MSPFRRTSAYLPSPLGTLTDNRNFAMFCGVNRVLVIDDDISGVTKRHLQQLATALDRGLFAGARAEGVLDNSIISRDARDAGIPQGSFISGQFLAFETQGWMKSFPFVDEYNDDWAKMLMTWAHALDHGITFPHGTPFVEVDPVVQSGFSRSRHDVARAISQEKGDALFEGLFAILATGKSSQRFSRDVWRDYQASRLDFLNRVQRDLATKFDLDRHPWITEPERAAIRVQRSLSPSGYVRAMQLLQERGTEWAEFVDASRSGTMLDPSYIVWSYGFRPPRGQRALLNTPSTEIVPEYWSDLHGAWHRALWKEPVQALTDVLNIGASRFELPSCRDLAMLVRRAEQKRPGLSARLTVPARHFTTWTPDLEADCREAGMNMHAINAMQALATNAPVATMLTEAMSRFASAARQRESGRHLDIVEDSNATLRLKDVVIADIIDRERMTNFTPEQLLDIDRQDLIEFIERCGVAYRRSCKALKNSNVSLRSLDILRNITLASWHESEFRDTRRSVLKELMADHEESARLQLFCHALRHPTDVDNPLTNAEAAAYQRELQQEPAIRRVAVVIPTFGHHSLTHELVESLNRQRRSIDISIIVVDNNAYNESVPTLGADQIYDARNEEEVVYAHRNLGWAEGANRGIRHAFETVPDLDGVVILQNDCQISNNFIESLVAAAETTGAGIVGPVYNVDWTHQLSPYRGPATHYVPIASYRPVPFIDDTCMYISRSTLLKTGGLRTAPFGLWGQDIDLAMRARDAGIGVVVSDLAYVNHTRGRTNAILLGDDYRSKATSDLALSFTALYGRAWVDRVWDGFARPASYAELVAAADHSRRAEPEIGTSSAVRCKTLGSLRLPS